MSDVVKVHRFDLPRKTVLEARPALPIDKQFVNSSNILEI